MQQYFIDEKINCEQNVNLRDDIVYHLTKVLRLTNKEFRLVDQDGKVFLASIEGKTAKILKQIDENNELECNITCIMSLIKQDKFELTLQKLTELGVKRIVPFNAKRSVVKETKADKKLERYKKILMEAAEQSHRNIIPEITSAIDLKDIDSYLSDVNLLAYEKEDVGVRSNLKAKSITYIIGPEGGFDKDEVDVLIQKGFQSISLGKRILRAETAAMHLASLIVGENE